MRVCIVPTYQGADQGDGGIRRVVEAQQRYLPELGIHVTDTPGDADLIACHGTSLVEQLGVPLVAHNHGLMWREYEFGAWGDDVNRHCIELMVRAQAVTAPSKWVANAISRGMLVRPEVVYHGVDAGEWEHSHDHLGYVLWNKARADQVSDPEDMNTLASLLPHIPFVSTFGERAQNVILTGPRSYTEMRPIVQKAGVYLATARETFGIGTLEALAAGVPVAGWRYGGQEEIIIDGETGYLAEWGDYEGLAIAIQRCLADRARLARNAVDDARARWGWQDKIALYAALYQDVLARWTAPRVRVSVVVTTHNLAHYLGDALRSVANQTMTDWECLVIDDASTDNPQRVVEEMRDRRFMYRKTPTNLKLSGARNYGWHLATGKYIIFLDADDMLAPNALDILSTALENETGTHIAYGHLDTVNDRGEDRKRNPWPPDRFDWRQQLAHLNQLPYAAMLRREVLERSGGYRTRDWRAEDAALWCRLTSFGFRAKKVTEDSTLIYRMRGDSKSRGEPGDGDWTAWYPWRLASSGPEGLQVIEEKKQPNPALVPFGAQGIPPLPLRAWEVPHHQHPAVSIIIPVGPGHARHLIDALDSVQAQTCGAWECIVVDDTHAIEINDPINVGAACRAHPWARVVNTPGGTGAGAARNAGLRAARAPLVLFLDADDMLTPRAVEQMLRAYVANGGGYVYSDWASLEDEGKWDGEADWHHTPEYSEDLWFQGFQHPVTCLVETEHARAVRFDEKLPAWEDWKLYLDLLVRGVCPVKVAEPLLIYRLSSGTRRKAAANNEARLLKTIRDRYAPYITGLESLMGCCNGNTAALNAARTALDDMLGPLAEELAFAAPPVEAGVVRMEFIGDNQGSQIWFSKDRQRRYEGGRDPRVRFIDAAPEDAEYLTSLGVWRVVELPREPEPELILAGAVVEEPREHRQRAKKPGR